MKYGTKLRKVKFITAVPFLNTRECGMVTTEDGKLGRTVDILWLKTNNFVEISSRHLDRDGSLVVDQIIVPCSNVSYMECFNINTNLNEPEDDK